MLQTKVEEYDVRFCYVKMQPRGDKINFKVKEIDIKFVAKLFLDLSIATAYFSFLALLLPNTFSFNLLKKPIFSPTYCTFQVLFLQHLAVLFF